MLFELGTDMLLFGVVAAIALNRVFQASAIPLSRLAYVLAQAINMAFVLALFSFRIQEFVAVPRADLGIRVFLMCFVAWHMVRNNQVRTKLLRSRAEAEQVIDERRQRMEAFASEQPTPGDSALPDGSVD